jgi:ribonuclease P protein component
MDKSYPKTNRLLKKIDFSYIQGAKKLYSKGINIFWKPSRVSSNLTRVGISVSKKVNKRAVVRNRIKRKIREWFRNSKYKEKGIDILIVVYSNLEEDNIYKNLEYMMSKKFK